MREIIFRGKRVDNGAWIEGGFHRWETRMPCVLGTDTLKPEETKAMITINSFADWNMPRTMQAVEVDPATISQYTGLKDKNGKRIFEGDIIIACIYESEFEDEYLSNTPIKVTWGGGYFYPFHLNGCWRSGVSGIEIIGNIWDNPELLEGGVNDG